MAANNISYVYVWLKVQLDAHGFVCILYSSIFMYVFIEKDVIKND
jgi:hypothetical protein